MQVTENTSRPRPFALFAKGFRCFFLGAALIAAGSITIWVLFYSGEFTSAFDYYPPIIWHKHEMVFGYGGAVIAGFLLTAVSNWTGRETLAGLPLAGLFGIWLAAHILPFIPASPGWLIALLNVLFFLALAVSVAIPIMLTGNHRNLFVVVILTVMAMCTALVHAQLLGFTQQGANTSVSIGFYLQLLLIVIIAGRVFPMFSTGGVSEPYQPVRKQWLEVVSVLSFILFAMANLFAVAGSAMLIVVIVTAGIHSLIVAWWFNRQIFSKPLVWVLHVGYYFLIVGMLMMGLAEYFPGMRVLGLHAMLVGGLGLITIGMMARVSLGHTGRNIHSPPGALGLIFLAVIFSSIIRVFLPLLSTEYYLIAIKVSGIAWALAFVWFLIHYTTVYFRPRIDGAAG